MESGDGVAGASSLLKTVLYSPEEGKQVEELNKITVFVLSKPLVNIFKAPLARITLLSQVRGMYPSSFCGVMMGKPPSILQGFSRIVTEEGFKSLWKGNLVNIARGPPSLAIKAFLLYKSTRYVESLYPEDRMSDTEEFLYTISYAISAVMSAFIATSAVYPMDLVRTRLASQRSEMYYNGFWHAFCKIRREEGFLGLYKGNGASLLRKAPKLAIFGSSCVLVKSCWESQRPTDSKIDTLIAAIGVSGVIASMATFPLDVVAKRLQLDGAGGKAKIYNTGLFGTFKHIIKLEGLRGLYGGILPEFLKVFPRVGFYFMTYQMLKMNDFLFLGTQKAHAESNLEPPTRVS